MLGLSNRARFVLTLLAVGGLCSSLPHSQILAGKDASSADAKEAARDDTSGSSPSMSSQDARRAKAKAKATTKKKARPETAKKKKPIAEDTASTPGTQSGGVLSPTVPNVPSGNSGTASGNSGTSGGKSVASTTGSSKGNADKATGDAAAPPAPPRASPPPDPELVKMVMDVQNRATKNLMAQKGVVGTATGLDEDDNLVIRVYTTGTDSPQIPKTIEGIPVVEIMKGPIFKAQTAFVPAFRQRLTRPVPIGVSVFSDVGCFSGTLGCRLVDQATALLQPNGKVYALSTNHVFAGDTSTGSTGVVTSGNPIGTPVVQPAPADDNCINGIVADQLGPLAAVITVVADGVTANAVDAAIITTSKALVNSSTPAGGYGAPQSTLDAKGNPFTTPAFLGQQLQKFGRTSGYTQGKVVGLNVSVTIPYGVGNALFTNQIEVVGIGSFNVFGTFGDSGALAVDFNRNPIGLLFASNGNNAFLNPFGQVIQLLSTKVGAQLSTASPFGSPGGGGLVVGGGGGGGGGGGTGVPPGPIVKDARSTPNSP